MAKAPAGDAITFAEGQWHDGSPALIRPRDHGFWLASAVFDGARSIAGKAPDLDHHCARLLQSAELMGLVSPLAADEIVKLVRDGIAKFPGDAALYICPLLYPSGGFIVPDPASTQFVLHIGESPLPDPSGFSACITRFHRPLPDSAPTGAKASCLYPNVARGVAEANGKGFDVGVTLDPSGAVAEFSYANLFMGQDGAIHTPAINGTFLNGITRQRIIKLLRDAGTEVYERTLGYGDFLDADEIFSTGNYNKVVPVKRIEDRELQPGPVAQRARDLYWEFAHG